MKKFVALLLGSAMAVSAIAGLAACKDPESPGGKVTITRRADPRATDAYEAYDYEGTKIGAYKTIADAINATVNADKDYFEDEETPDATAGGYVTKKGGTMHIFNNRKGFAAGNSDQFWYYENGTELTAYNCWDNTYGVSNLQNQKVIVHQVADMGLSSIQSWNGFGLLDEFGQEIDYATVQPPTWELSKPMDAGVMMFPTRKVGVTGLRYKIDMSNVKITPAYEGFQDDIYAYMGFYAWQDYYVISFGIACNTLTGEWYQFRGTSRDDSFSDTNYKIGAKLADSTWNKTGGYWTPKFNTFEMQAKTVRKFDDMEEKYWEDEVEIKLDKKSVKFSIDDQTVNSYFAGNGVGAENAYMFIAGLDIKNEIVNAPNVANVDYFNGAKFENLAVTEAEIYFPTEEEMTDSEYALAQIDTALRGKWHDALMANTDYTEGTYDYTMLVNYLCSSYEKKDGQDVYSFRYDGSPVSENEIGGQLKIYQDVIDSLIGVSVDTIGDFEEELELIEGWYGTNEDHDESTINQQYHCLLNFKPYEDALIVLKESLALSDEAKALLTDLEALSNITAGYDYKGWTAATGTAMTGYLYTELEYFRAKLALVDALTEPLDKPNLIRLFGKDNWEAWAQFDLDMKAIEATAGWADLEFTTFAAPMGTVKDTTYKGNQLLDQLFYWGYAIRSGKNWDSFGSDLNDDGNGAGAKVMQFDTSTYPSFRVIDFVEFLEKSEVELPTLAKNLLDGIGYDSFYEGAWYPLTNMVKLGLRIEGGTGIVDFTEAEMEFLNKVWTAGYTLSAHISWNWISGEQFAKYMDGRGDRIITLMGGDTTKHMRGYVAIIANYLKSLGYTIRQETNGWGTTASAISNEPDNSAAAQKVVTDFEALSKLSTYDYKGWTTTDTNIKGYMYSEIVAFRAIETAYNALSMNEQLYVNTTISRAEFLAWQQLSEEVKTLAANAIWTKSFVALAKAFDTEYAMADYTGEQVLAEIIKVALTIKSGSVLADSTDTGTNNVIKIDENYYTALRLVSMYHFYAVEGVELPTYVKGLVEEVGGLTFYTEAYYPLYYTVQVADAIDTTPYDKTEDLTADELAFLNEVWVSGYTLKEPIASGVANDFAGMETQVSYLVALALGAKSTKTLVDYIGIVGDFLEGANYTLKDNGWGVTSSEILKASVTADTVALIGEFNKLSKLAAFNSNGWEAPAETAMTGYLYSEAKFFMESIAPAFEALADNQKEAFLLFVGADVYNNWKEIATFLTKAENAGMLATKITAANRAWGTTQTYTVGEAIGEMLTSLGTLTGPMDSDNRWKPSFRTYFFLTTIEEMGIELPTAIYSLVAVREDANALNFKKDIAYIGTVLRIAKLLETNPDLKLTAKIVKMVNDNMVGITRFAEGGLHWNYTNGGETKNNDFWYREKNYKSYYGLNDTPYFSAYLTKVITFLTSEAVGATATDTGLGITAALAPAADTLEKDCACEDCSDNCYCVACNGTNCPCCPPAVVEPTECTCQEDCDGADCDCAYCQAHEGECDKCEPEEEEPECTCPDCSKDDQCECEGNCSDGNCECEGCTPEEEEPETTCTCAGCDNEDGTCNCEETCENADCEACAGGCTSED